MFAVLVPFEAGELFLVRSDVGPAALPCIWRDRAEAERQAQASGGRVVSADDYREGTSADAYLEAWRSKRCHP